MDGVISYTDSNDGSRSQAFGSPTAIRHSDCNPFRIRSSEKYPGNSFAIRTSKFIGLKVL